MLTRALLPVCAQLKNKNAHACLLIHQDFELKVKTLTLIELSMILFSDFQFHQPAKDGKKQNCNLKVESKQIFKHPFLDLLDTGTTCGDQ